MSAIPSHEISGIIGISYGACQYSNLTYPKNLNNSNNNNDDDDDDDCECSIIVITRLIPLIHLIFDHHHQEYGRAVTVTTSATDSWGCLCN